MNEPITRQLRGADGPGFVVVPEFCNAEPCGQMLAAVVDIVRREAAGEDVAPALITKETQEGFTGSRPEDLAAKVFCLHRTGPFREFLSGARVTTILQDTIGPDVDCFLSQFIFKNPGAWGQPWHQDAFYFPFEPDRPIVGLWLAITEATLANGCLHVVPGSQAEPVHEHVPDARPGSQYGYVEIVDHDMSGAQPCLLSPGDLMLFDSHLMHRSTDNTSTGIRAAMVWHCAPAGMRDLGQEFRGGGERKSRIRDWMPVLRAGKNVVPPSAVVR